MRLTAASPLPPKQAREIMRDRLHTQPSLDDAVVADVCEALQVAPVDFPRDLSPAPLTFFPGTMDALRALSELATVVTLSNVTCADADTEGLRRRTAPWVSDFFPSCRIGYAKPDPRAFIAVAEHCGVAPAQILHIGDDWACDVVGAVAAGLRAVWISRGRQAPDPDLIVDHGVLVADSLSAAVQHVRALSSTEETTP
jgi:HAD superfamily hydrolase (TIGR01509 family)